ncbi:MAG TPA: c-type cytochrome [Gallionellaceae bacterium]|nr:c-type cytochrome [Gallionellaceae bacterium]
MKTVSIRKRVAAVFGGVALFALAPQFALAMDAQLEKAVAHGKDMFYHDTFGGNGKTCESCHSGGGKQPGKLPNGKAIPSLENAAAIFPHVRARDHKLVTLPDQVHSCVAGALKGTPPDYGSEDLNALVAYITSLANGKKIDMGGKPE